MSSNKTRKSYDNEFKKRAVRSSYGSERSLREVADSLDIDVQLLYRWRQEFTSEGEKIKPRENQDDVSVLRLQIAELEDENSKLKKVIVILSKYLKD